MMERDHPRCKKALYTVLFGMTYTVIGSD